MPNQPEHEQPSSSRNNPLPDATQDAQRSPPPALLPQHQVVMPPPIHHEESQVPEPRSGAMSPLRDAGAGSSFMSRVRGCLGACSNLLVCQCSTAARVHPVGVIPVQPATGSYNPAKENARKTHYLSNFITRVQCFLMPTIRWDERSFLARGNDIKKILGICVQFRNKKCDQLCCRCEDCGVCPHLYSCSCPDFYKHKGTSWCAHIHVMHTLTKGKFKEKVCLYIQTDKRYMLIRHVRGYIQGQNFMMPLPGDCFEEVVDNLDVSSKYKVSRLKDDKEECKCLVVNQCIICKGCRCRFACSCPDFIVDGQVCQHIHNVLMLQSSALFVDFTMMRDDYSYKLIATHDWNLKYYVELEHEMSFYIDLKNIEKQKGFPPDDLRFSSVVDISCKGEVNARNVDSDSESDAEGKLSDRDSWWIIYRNKKVECRVRSHFRSVRRCICREDQYPSNSSCARCKICFRHYTCSCPLDSSIICRHVHAIQRMLNNSQETEEGAEQYVKEHLPVPAMFAYLPEGQENWARILRREDASTEAKQSEQMAVLPPPTD